VSELLEGETLRNCLKRGPLSIRRANDFALQVTRGLATAHEKGIVHRDLKPENLFITNDSRIKILDFGLAKLMQAEIARESGDAPTIQAVTEARVVMGTVGYMSPEQVRGKEADTRSDIFSFGAILYEMLSGKRAFQGAIAADTMSALLNDDPPELFQSSPGVSSALDCIVRRCLEKEPADRFQSARDLGFALQAVTGSNISSGGFIHVLLVLGLVLGLASLRWRGPLAALVRSLTATLATLTRKWGPLRNWARLATPNFEPVLTKADCKTIDYRSQFPLCSGVRRSQKPQMPDHHPWMCLLPSSEHDSLSSLCCILSI
jgi:serine/threonine protein kinase